MSDVQHTCVSCGQTHEGLYCHVCGEKRLDPNDRKLKYYLHQLVSAVTFADNKAWRTLRSVIVNPGKLSLDYAAGRRVRYTAPVSLFFIGNLIYFLIPILETFDSSLYVQTQMMPYKSWIMPSVEGRLADRSISMDEYAVAYNAASTSNAKLLLITMVFLISIGFAVVAMKKNRYFGDHFIMSLKVNIYNLFVNTIALALLIFPIVLIGQLAGADLRPYLNDQLFTVLILFSLIYFLFRSFRTMYACTTGGAAWRTVFMLAWVAVSLQAYRFILFWVTFYTT